MELVEIVPTGEIARYAGYGLTDIARTVVPTDGEPGYAHGCICRKVNGTTVNDAIYFNYGTNLSCNFDLVSTVLFNTDTLFEFQFGGISGLKVDDATIGSYVAAENTSGKSVFLATQIGGEVGGEGGNFTITAGNGAASGAAAAGGSIRLAPGANGPDSSVAGVVVIGPGSSSMPLFTPQSAPTAETGTSQSYTAAKLLNGIITSTQASAVTGTLVTGALMDASVPIAFLGTGVAFEWTLINLGSASGAVTVTGDTGHTVVGDAVVAVATSATFRTRRTAANTWITYRK